MVDDEMLNNQMVDDILVVVEFVAYEMVVDEVAV
jgi:hypothetical protein